MKLVVAEKPLVETIQAGSQVSICYNFLKDNYKLKYNVITGNIEDHSIKFDGKPKIIEDRELNTIYIKLSNYNTSKEKVSKDYLCTFIFSEFTEIYNPLKQFFEDNSHIKRSPQLISDLASTIKTDTKNAEKYIKHWGCGMIASIFGSQSPLTLVLAGEKLNTGKTEWFRRLLPQELLSYYAESPLDDGKDSDILMCKKLIIMDDEFGGKSKKNQQHFKGLTSRQFMSIRIPYGKTTTEMRRICSLCGTSNELELLSDPYGNRRILAINVLSIDHDLYNSIDKTELLMSFYDLYKSGFHWKFKQEDVDLLNSTSENFQAVNPESELIYEYFEVPKDENDGEYMTNTAIKDFIETRTKQKIWNPTKLGIELKKLGFHQQRKHGQRVYLVKPKKEPISIPTLEDKINNQTKPIIKNVYEDGLPF